jgi:hypothetical protein
MEILLGAVYTACTLGVLYCAYMLYRTEEVYRFRREIILNIPEVADFQWRFAEFDKVSYTDMMYKNLGFSTLTLETFWDDLSFLDPSAKNPHEVSVKEAVAKVVGEYKDTLKALGDE